MNVSHLVDELLFTPDIEIIVTPLPEPAAHFGDLQFTGDNLLQHLYRNAQLPALGLAHQQVHVLGHRDVGINVKAIPAAYSLRGSLQHVTCGGRGKIRGAVITSESNVMRIPCLLESLQSAWPRPPSLA